MIHMSKPNEQVVNIVLKPGNQAFWCKHPRKVWNIFLQDNNNWYTDVAPRCNCRQFYSYCNVSIIQQHMSIYFINLWILLILWILREHLGSPLVSIGVLIAHLSVFCLVLCSVCLRTVSCVLCSKCSQCDWIIHFRLPFPFSLTFIWNIGSPYIYNMYEAELTTNYAKLWWVQIL